MPPPARHPENWNTSGENNPRPNTGESQHTSHATEVVDDEFIPVTWNGKGKKGKGNNAPTSYAMVAASAANIQQPTTQLKSPTCLPAITKVTVICSGNGGHSDPEVELGIRAQAADVIVREIRLKMGTTVPNPIALRAGR